MRDGNRTTGESEKLRITKTRAAKSISRTAVLESYLRHEKGDRPAAEKVFKKFFSELLSILNLRWFSRRPLTQQESHLVAALCETEGADRIILTHESRIVLGLLPISYEQSIAFTPDWQGGAKAEAVNMVVRVGQRQFVATNLRRALLAYSVLFFLGVVFYVIATGLLLYGFATFILFVVLPADTTVAATIRPSVGLSLLCFMVGLAAIAGRALTNMGRLLITTLRRRR